MTKADFAERCTEADHVWEALEQGLHPTVYACAHCLTYARRDGAAMRTIMCAKPKCSSPACSRKSHGSANLTSSASSFLEPKRWSSHSQRAGLFCPKKDGPSVGNWGR
jgi:hypothetical protein